MRDTWVKIQSSLDSMIVKYGSIKVSDWLDRVSSSLGKDPKPLDYETLMFITSVKYNIRYEDIKKGEGATPSEFRMIIQHILHRNLELSIGEISKLFECSKGSTHRFIEKMDGLFELEKYHVSLIDKYNFILNEYMKIMSAHKKLNENKL